MNNGDDSIQALCNLIWNVNPQVYNRFHLLDLCSEPACDAAKKANIDFLSYKILNTDDQRLDIISKEIGLAIPPWKLKTEELTPHCISEPVLKHIQKAEPYHPVKQMLLIVAECKTAGTSRCFMELLHSKITRETDPEFSSKLKLILASCPKFEPNSYRHQKTGGDSDNGIFNQATGFTFGLKRKNDQNQNSSSPKAAKTVLF
jgi:hypothetical protein